MTQPPKSTQDTRKLLGATLLPLGLLLLLVNVGANLAATFSSLGFSTREVDYLHALALWLFRVVQSYFFDHARFLHGLDQILLSCWPILLVLTGILLLQNAIRSQLQARIVAVESSNIGERS